METVTCPNPWCQLTFGDVTWEEALQRGRFDHSFFWHFFLLRCPHPGQLQFVSEAEATINALACSNRYGKTTLCAGGHFHACIYKTGAEPRFMDEDGVVDLEAFKRERYRTVHAAGLWDQVQEVVDDARSLINNSPRLAAFIQDAPLSKPTTFTFINGAKWLFRTLGDNASGIDGKNFYLLSIDEAGWISNLLEMMNNVLRVRVADVRGRIWIVGTFKPGVSKDFFKICSRASSYTGAALGLDHRSDVEGDEESDVISLDAALRKYAKEFGLDLDAAIAEYEAGMAA
jgi:hypothetical protein